MKSRTYKRLVRFLISAVVTLVLALIFSHYNHQPARQWGESVYPLIICLILTPVAGLFSLIYLIGSVTSLLTENDPDQPRWLRPVLIGGLALGIAVMAVLGYRYLFVPVDYPATNGRNDWLKYSSRENGFELRYPADWRMNQDRNRVSFTRSDNLSFAVYWIPAPVEAPGQKSPSGSLPARRSGRRAIIAGLRGEQFSDLSGNFEGTWRVESFVIPGASGTYQMSWTNGSTTRRETDDDRMVCHAILSTFRLVERQHSEYTAYRDPANRFAFEFPSSWRSSGGLTGSPAANLHNGINTWIDVSCIAQTSLEKFQKYGVTEMTAQTEWFAHRIPGVRCLSNGHEAYIFPRGPDLVVITIFRSNESAEVMAHFFDSFTLGP